MRKTGLKSGITVYWRECAAQLKQLRSIVGAGVLAAVGVVLKGLTLPLGQMMRIGFAFLPTALSGYLYGPVVAGLAGAMLDVLGFFVGPPGPYFFGFTLSAFVNGFIYGLWLWNRPVKLWRTLAACFTSMLIVSFLLNTLWLSILYGEAWLPLLLLRIPKSLLLLPVNTSLLFLLLKVTEKQKKRVLRS